MHKGFRALLAGLGLAMLGAGAASAQTWPDRPIKLIIPYAAGGVSDGIVRLLSGPMERKLGQKLVVESRPGALGNVGAQEVVRAEPDGYTLLVGATNNFVINQFLVKMTFDPLTALVPIAKLANIPLVLFGNPAQPARTFAELAAFARANPGKLTYGTPSPGTVNHLFVERLKQTLGLDIVHLPFRGSPPATLALLQNDIQLFPVGLAAALEHVKDGKLVALAVATERRMPQIPEVSTMSEQGFPRATVANWFAMAAPKGTPEAVVRLVAEAVGEGHKEKAVQDRFTALGMLVPVETPAQFAASLPADARIWEETIAKGKIAAQ